MYGRIIGGTDDSDIYTAVSLVVQMIAVCLSVGCLTSQQHASESQGRMYSDNFTCCHTEIEVANQTVHLSHNIQTPGQPVPALSL